MSHEVVEKNVGLMMILIVIVISFGQKIAEGLPEDVRKNKDVIRAYLGGEYA